VLLERKRVLRKLLPRRSQSIFYVEHVESGTDLFQAICEQDMEGIVAKQTNARYTPNATTWVKIKNRAYSQAVGRGLLRPAPDGLIVQRAHAAQLAPPRRCLAVKAPNGSYVRLDMAQYKQ
jgi:hypothetical protein